MVFTPQKIDLTTNVHSHYEAFRIINDNFVSISNDIIGLGAGLAGGFEYYKWSLTGGDYRSLDSVDGGAISAGERALVIEGSSPARVYIYVATDNGAVDERVPWVIEPDVNAGGKRWILAARIPRLWGIDRSPTPVDDRSAGVTVGDFWLSDGNFWICSDDSPQSAVWIKLLKVGVSEGTACAGNDPRLPGLEEKKALGGTSGIPGDTNRYVTSEDLRLSDSRAPTAHNHELAEIDCGGITESYSPIIVGDSGSFSDVFDGGFF